MNPCTTQWYIPQVVETHCKAGTAFCTAGVLVAAKALLDRSPNPTETETRYWLAGNLCRCTGYDKIVRRRADAAAGMRGA